VHLAELPGLQPDDQHPAPEAPGGSLTRLWQVLVEQGLLRDMLAVGVAHVLFIPHAIIGWVFYRRRKQGKAAVEQQQQQAAQHLGAYAEEDKEVTPS
jgi:ABC-type transport system involved in cytochrome bd biosynthesis fused ATPase/permease subunit